MLSLAGVYNPSAKIEESKVPSALKTFFNHHKEISNVVLHLDNDKAGISSASAIKIALSTSYNVINNPPLYGKDYNDYLLRTLQYNKLQKTDIGDRIWH